VKIMDKEQHNCENIKILLSAYLDNEVSAEEAIIIEKHLAICPDCREELDFLKNISSKVQHFLGNHTFEMPDLTESVINRYNRSSSLSCGEVLEELSAYFDGELSPSVYYSVEDHLSECEECNEKFQQLEKLRALIKLSVDSLDIDLWESVYKRIITPEELKCQFILDQLSAYIDKEVDSTLAKNISEHLLLCKKCRKEFNELKSLSALTQKALQSPAKDINLWPQVYVRLTEEIRSKTFLATTVASAFMVVLVWLVLSVTFPVSNTDNIISVESYSENNLYRPDRSEVSVVTSNDFNSADSYLFTNVFDEPPSGVIPTMYYSGASDVYEP